MSAFDFDRIIDRRGTACLKYDFGLQRAGREDLLPMWVADMDFALPENILARIRERIDHGIFGYTDPDDAYYKAVEYWFERHCGWKINREWISVVPGVVYGIAAAVRALTKNGDAVIIQEPVYYPFREMIEENGRVCINSQLVEKDGRYEMDLADFEQKIREYKVKAFILCSPHNPVGRVWSREELRAVGDICLKNGVRMIVDEIHCDFIFPGHSFTPFALLGETYSKNAVFCTSPSKTFNMAGLQVANILIPDEQLRRAFRKINSANGYSQANAAGLAAARAVYEEGDAWLDALGDYLAGNLDYMRSFLKEKLPQLRMIEPEGTYLVWVDFSGLTDNFEDLLHLVRDEAHLWLDEGAIFGEETRLFERFNIACPRSVLKEALESLEQAVQIRMEKQ